MAKKNDRGEWIAGNGKAVHPKNVKAHIRERDAIVESIFKQMDLLEQAMKFQKEQIHSMIEDYKLTQEEIHGASFSDTGAITLTGYSGDKQIEIKVNNLVKHNELVQLAEDKLKECIRNWSNGANENLHKVVDFAFQLDGKGNLDRSRLATLRAIEINDPDWQKGLDLLKESEEAAGSRKYLVIRERKEFGEKLEMKNFNFSTI